MAIQPSTPIRSNLSGSPTTPETDDVVWNLEEAAAYLHCHAMTINRDAEKLHIPHKRLGSLWRFSAPAVKGWMNHREQGENQGTPKSDKAA